MCVCVHARVYALGWYKSARVKGNESNRLATVKKQPVERWSFEKK